MATVLRGSDNFDTDGLDNTKDRVASAWAWIDGVTASIHDSYNISSVTDNGVGNYLCNFTTIMVDTNYVMVGTFNDIADTSTRTTGFYNEGKNTSLFNIITKTNGVPTDGVVNIIVFGGKN